MALPNTNISVAMVKAELGAATNDVGRLCIHPNINKWSKWKPVRHTKVTPLTEEDLNSIVYGLNVPVTFDNDYLIALEEWGYNRPRGGDNNPPEPYRLADFRNYNHGAYSPIHVPEPIPINAINQQGIYYIEGEAATGNTYQIGVEDLHGSVLQLGNYYFGIIFKTPANQVYIKTANSPLSTSDLEVTFPGNAPFLNYTNVDIYFVLSDTKVNSVSLLDSIGLVRLCSIPSETRHYNVSIIRSLSQLIPVTFNNIGLTKNGPFTPLWQYLPGPTQQYFQTNAMGALYAECRIDNSGAENFVIQRSDMNIGVSNWVDGTVNSLMFTPELYNSSGTAITSISVPAGSYVNIRIGHPSLLTGNQSIIPMPGDNSQTEIILRYRYQSAWLDWMQSDRFLIRYN